MKEHISSVWLVSREYAGIAEAGGVKNVACSLAEGLIRQNVQVTAFIPRYGCVRQEGDVRFRSTVTVMDTEYRVSYSETVFHGVRIILIDSPIFSEKDDVYVYSERESRMVHGAVRGRGHDDTDCMNMVHQRSVLEFARLTQSCPEIIHCQDAHTAILPVMAQKDPQYTAIFRNSAFVVTIHNAGPGYRQLIPGIDRARELTGLSNDVLSPGMVNGLLEPFLLASSYAHLTTVSPWYAEELSRHEYGTMTEGLSSEFERRGIHITGILNGIDYHRYEPPDTSRSLLPFPYDPRINDLDGKYRNRHYLLENLKELANEAGLVQFGTLKGGGDEVYFVYQGRIVAQKGLTVFIRAARLILPKMPEARFIVLGQGDPLIEKELEEISAEYEHSFVYLQGYERAMARLAVVAADFLVLPSLFEPCGLEDYIGQIFGTIPVANAVGGLQKIRDGENGFLYSTGLSANPETILADRLIALAEPIAASSGEGAASVPEYRNMMCYASTYVSEHCDWDSVIREKYYPFYSRIII